MVITKKPVEIFGNKNKNERKVFRSEKKRVKLLHLSFMSYDNMLQDLVTYSTAVHFVSSFMQMTHPTL